MEDLQGKCTRVAVKCDGENCENPDLSPRFIDYQKCVKEDGKYYCKKCAIRLYGGENSRKMRLINGTSFEKWCLDNNRQDVLDRWSYELNNLKPSEVSDANETKRWFNCENTSHIAELKNIKSFTRGKGGSISCNQCNSFEQWCIDNNRQDILCRWDYDLNTLKPSEIKHATTYKQYFKCERGLHPSELKTVRIYTQAKEGSMYCSICHSFEQWCIDNDKEDVLIRWDYELNKKNPTEVNSHTKQEYWFKCPRGIHKSELQHIDWFTRMPDMNIIKCNVCNSFAQWGIDNLCQDFLEKYWDYDKNIVYPWKINYTSKPKRWIKCQEGENHKSYSVTCGNFRIGSRCPECNKSKGEIRIREYFYLNDYNFIPQKEFERLVGLGNGLLSYDFYLPQYNLLIEYQGRYHDGTVSNQTEEAFEKQQEHDKRKKEYALRNGYNLLEIWYWDFDNIEKILKECKFISDK